MNLPARRTGTRATIWMLTGLTLTAAGGLLGGHAAAAITPPAPIPQTIAFATDAEQNDAADASATAQGQQYPGDPDRESTLVAAEDDQLAVIRESTSAARWRGVDISKPFVITPGGEPTLVLVARASAYTWSDLVAALPTSFVKQPDKSYLLSANLVVETGAQLDLSVPADSRIRLLSSPQRFVSIIALGGTIRGTGTEATPLRVQGWDGVAGSPDSLTDDGRAYLRVIGGTAVFTNAVFDHLGFWSGNTGGLAITGSERDAELTAPTTPDSDEEGTATAKLNEVDIRQNAYGVFVNGASGVSIANSSVSDSLVDGIVFHRNVTSSSVRSTTVSGNAVDGLSVTRASRGISVTNVVSEDNGRDGISLDGTPLANGPSANGAAVDNSGNNFLVANTTRENARYGIRVVGGEDIRIAQNRVANNETGIAVSGSSDEVTLSNNTVSANAEHGISITEGVAKATVTENTVTTSETGIYLRNSSGTIEHNRVSLVTNHGVTLVGDMGTTRVSNNTVAGKGPTAIDVERATGAVVGKNNVDDWARARPLSIVVREVFQPLTVLWLVLATLIVVTATYGAKGRRQGIHNPYASLTPLSELTDGLVDPAEIGLPRPVADSMNTTAHHAAGQREALR